MKFVNFIQELSSDTTCWTSGLNNLRGGELSFKIFPLINFNPLFKWYMIDLKCIRRSNNQFNWCYLNVQDKIDCNKINEIREERIANSIYTGSATSRAYVQSSCNPLEIFHYLCKSFTISEHTLGSLTLVFKILTSQEINSLLIRTEYMRCTKRFLSFRVDDTNWISSKNSQ